MQTIHLDGGDERDPDVPRELLQWLLDSYPPRCIRPGQSMEDAIRYAGKVDLVTQLEAMHVRQQSQDSEAPA